MFCSSPCSRRLLGSRRCSIRDGVKETQTERRWRSTDPISNFAAAASSQSGRLPSSHWFATSRWGGAKNSFPGVPHVSQSEQADAKAVVRREKRRSCLCEFLAGLTAGQGRCLSPVQATLVRGLGGLRWKIDAGAFLGWCNTRQHPGSQTAEEIMHDVR